MKMKYVIYNRTTGTYYTNSSDAPPSKRVALTWDSDIHNAHKLDTIGRARRIETALQKHRECAGFDIGVRRYDKQPVECCYAGGGVVQTEHLGINEVVVLGMIFVGTLDSLAKEVDEEYDEKYPAWVCNAIVSLKGRGMITIHLAEVATITEKGKVFIDVLASLKEPVALTVWSMKSE